MLRNSLALLFILNMSLAGCILPMHPGGHGGGHHHDSSAGIVLDKRPCSCECIEGEECAELREEEMSCQNYRDRFCQPLSQASYAPNAHSVEEDICSCECLQATETCTAVYALSNSCTGFIDRACSG